MNNKYLRESLNKLDHAALDGDSNYYDLLTLFESFKSEMTDEDEKEISKLIKDKDSEKLHAYMLGIEDRGKQDTEKLTATTVESYKDDYTELNEIFEEETELEEGRNNLVPRKCKAQASGKPYYAAFDTKENDFAKFGIRFRYDTKDKCQDAINDPDNDMGYEDDKKRKFDKDGQEIKESAVIEEQQPIIEGEVVKGPFNVEIYYDSSKGKYRARANDGIHGWANCRFPNDLRSEATEYKVSQLDWLGDQYNVPRSVIIGTASDEEEIEPEVKKEPERKTGGMRTLDLSLFEDDNTVAGTEIRVSKELEDKLDDFLQMVKKGTKPTTGIPVEIWLALKIYKYSENGTDLDNWIPCPVINAAAGVPNPYIDHQANTQYRDLEKSGLISYSHTTYDYVPLLDADGNPVLLDSGKPKMGKMSYNVVKPTARLKDWIEGDNTFEVGVSHLDFRIYLDTHFDPEVNDTKKRASQVGPEGNFEKSRKGWTYKKTAKSEIPSDEVTIPKSSNMRGIDISMFEEYQIEESLEEAAERFDKDLIARKKQLYKEMAGLSLEEEITEDNLDDWTYKHMCSMNGWPFEQTKSELLSK